jgi:hypothetical protein
LASKGTRTRPKLLDELDENSEIVDRCLELIKPAADKEEHCRLSVYFGIISCAPPLIPNLRYEEGETKKRTKDRARFGKTLRKASAMLVGPGPAQWGLSGDELHERVAVCRKLDAWAARAEEMVTTCCVPSGAIPIDRAKLTAASNAFRLIKDFSGARPTLTAGGPFYELASTLYEGGTGNVMADLSWYCRKIFHRVR